MYVYIYLTAYVLLHFSCYYTPHTGRCQHYYLRHHKLCQCNMHWRRGMPTRLQEPGLPQPVTSIEERITVYTEITASARNGPDRCHLRCQSNWYTNLDFRYLNILQTQNSPARRVNLHEFYEVAFKGRGDLGGFHKVVDFILKKNPRDN